MHIPLRFGATMRLPSGWFGECVYIYDGFTGEARGFIATLPIKKRALAHYGH
jgi:hypothetical protein